MTFAPPTILEVRHFLKGEDPDLTDVELGITGGPSHVAQGTSYHLGRDQLKLSKDPYSARTPRDKAGLSNAASALDIDDDLDELRELSLWLVGQCMQLAPDTLDIREVIYSPDGQLVLRWDRERGGPPVPDSDTSHRNHTHVSWYRDSEFRDKTSVFKRFFREKNMPDIAGFSENANNHGWATTQMLPQYEVRPANDSTAVPVEVENLFIQEFAALAKDVQTLKETGVKVDTTELEALVRRVVREELDATKLGRAA